MLNGGSAERFRACEGSVPNSSAETIFALDRLKRVQPDLVAVSFGGLSQWKEWVEQNAEFGEQLEGRRRRSA